MDNSEKYLKDIAKNTADIAKELKKMNHKPVINLKLDNEDLNSGGTTTPVSISPKGIKVGKSNEDIFKQAELNNEVRF